MKKISRTVALISVLALSLTFQNTGAFAKAKDIEIYVNDSKIITESHPLMIDQRVLVPLRSVSEALDCEVQWDSINKKVRVKKGNCYISMEIGSTYASIDTIINMNLVNSRIIHLDVPTQIIDGRIMVPLRFISDSLGNKIVWDNTNRSIMISSSDKELDFPLEKGIEDAIRVSIKKPTGKLTEFDLMGVYDLNIDGKDHPGISDLSSLSKLKGLRTLTLTGLKVKDFTPIESLDTLEELSIRNCLISDLSPIKNLSNLRFIRLQGNPILDYGPIKEIPTQYPLDHHQLQTLANQSKKILNKIIVPNMTELEKEKAIHDYIVQNTSNDYSNTSPESSNAYGVLMNGKGTCGGIAEATFLLLSMTGIESEVIYGEANNGGGRWNGLTWNRVKIDGVWYNLNVTWNLSQSEKGKFISYNYFNVDDTTFKMNHRW